MINCLIVYSIKCPDIVKKKTKDSSFTIMWRPNDDEKQQILTFKNLEAARVWHLSIVKIVGKQLINRVIIAALVQILLNWI